MVFARSVVKYLSANEILFDFFSNGRRRKPNDAWSTDTFEIKIQNSN